MFFFNWSKIVQVHALRFYDYSNTLMYWLKSKNQPHLLLSCIMPMVTKIICIQQFNWCFTFKTAYKTYLLNEANAWRWHIWGPLLVQERKLQTVKLQKLKNHGTKGGFASLLLWHCRWVKSLCSSKISG